MNIDRIIEGLPWGSRRTSRLALDFARDFVSLFEQQPDGTWSCLGSAALSAPDFSKQIDGLRIEALMRDKHRTPVTLWLPEDQVLCRHYDLMDRHGVAAKAEALRLLQDDSPYAAEDLTVAVAPARDGEPVAVLAALRQTVVEAADYARRWGFVPGTASTRAYADTVGETEPEFLLHEKISARAGRIARGTAMATGALLAVSIGGLGAYHMAAPVLAPPSTVTATAALALPVADDGSVRHASLAPLAPTWIGQAQHLGLQTGPAGLRNPDTAARHQSYSNFTVAFDLPALIAPAWQTEMHVGAIADAPHHTRPGRLAGATTVATASRGGKATRVTRTSARIVETVSDDAETALDSAVAADTPPEDAVIAVADVTIADTPAAEQAPSERQTANTNTEQSDDQVSEFAPQEMARAPASRPDDLTGIADEDDTAATDVAETETAAETKAATADVAATVAVTSRIGRSRPANGEIEPVEARTDAGATVAGRRIAAPAPDLDPASLDGALVATLSAPRPLVRPRNLITLKPVVDKQRTDTSNTDSGSRLQNRPVAPRTVRAAATQHGLALGQASLIGVIEAKNGRKALIRLPSGDYRKVERGDDLDGWRVGAVGRETLKLTRRGQNRTLILVSR